MYLNLIEIAESFGVAERVIEDWIREQGLPHTLDRGRLLFDRAQVAHWAAAHGLTARTGFLAPDANPLSTSVALAPLLKAGGIWRDIPETGAESTLERVLGSLTQLSGPVRALLTQRLKVPGGINWASVGDGLALPHFGTRVTLGRGSGVVALIMARTGFALPEAPVDGVAVTRLFFFVPPSPRAHLEMLGRLSRAIQGEPLLGLVKSAAPDSEILAALEAFDRRGVGSGAGGVGPGAGDRGGLS